MAIEVTMPRLGLTMESGIVVRWLKKPGDAVSRGDALVEIETDKSVVEVAAPADGFLRRIVVEEGREVPVGAVIGLLTATADEPMDDGAGPGPSAEMGEAAPARGNEQRLSDPARPRPLRASDEGGSVGVRATPAARRRARELGVDLETVVGTGPGGRIQVEDVERAAIFTAPTGEQTSGSSAGLPVSSHPTLAGAPTPAAATRGAADMFITRTDTTTAPQSQRVELTRMRQAIARGMTISQQSVPQFTVGRHLDMRGPLQVYKTLAASLRHRLGVRLTLTDLLIQAVARTLVRHPYLNASYEEENGNGWLRLHGEVNLGIAVALEHGLIVPVLRGADKLSLLEIAQRRTELVGRARAQRLAPDEVSGATFTLSNLGPMDVDFFTAIVNPPEAAILAIGRLRDMAVVEDGRLVPRPTITAVLSVDHRAADGAQAAAFLDDLYRFLTTGDWQLE